MSDRVIDTIFQTIEEYNMFSPDETVLAAVSGGADSMLLLNFLADYRDKLKIRLKVAHVEHGIRGEESLRDEAFVKSYCSKRGIELSVLSINATEEAAKCSMGVEEYSRKRRYEFFNSLGCDKIATAHNLSDNVETLFFRLARGTGLKGLCCIPPVRDNIVRPLINLSSSQIRRFCDENNISYCIDSTNLSVNYNRNKIRNTILPLFSSINSAYEDKISDLIYDLTQDNSYIDNNAKKAFENVYKNGVIDKSGLLKYDIAIIKRVIIKFFDIKKIDLDRIHLENVISLLSKNGRIQIKGTVFCVSDSECLKIIDEKTSNLNIEKIPEYNTQILNINEFNQNNVDFYCDCDKIIGSVNLRRRISGDIISPAGRHCSKSLKKLFNEMKIPVEERNRVCVCVDDGGIIGVIGICADERVKIDSHTKNVFTISFIPED